MLSKFININNKLLGLIVPKGGNSYLKCIAGYYKTGKWTIETLGAVGDKYYEYEKDWKIVIPYDKGINTSIRKFVVYRDPFERFVSLYEDKIVRGNLILEYKDSGFNKESTFEEFLDYAEKSFLLGKIERHLLPITSRFKYEDIDDIVRLDDLDNYLLYHNIEIPKIHINSAPQKYDISKYEKYKERIISLYYKDYDMLKSKKLWLCSKLPDIKISTNNNYLTQIDYLEHINYILNKYNPISILDLGSGNTTNLFENYINNNLYASLYSVDHNIEFANINSSIYTQICNKNVSYYDGLLNDLKNSNRKYELISIDGPIGYMSNVPRIDILGIIQNDLLNDRFFIFIHDANRIGEKNLINLIRVMLDKKKILYYEKELNVESKGAYLITSEPISKI